MTALIAVTASEMRIVNRSAATACRLATSSQNAARPSCSERSTSAASGSRTTTLSQSVLTPKPSAPAPPTRPRSRRRASGAVVVAAEAIYLAVETPASSSILATEPCCGSKSSSLTFDQPPRSAIVSTFDGVANVLLFFSKTAWSTGR